MRGGVTIWHLFETLRLIGSQPDRAQCINSSAAFALLHFSPEEKLLLCCSAAAAGNGIRVLRGQPCPWREPRPSALPSASLQGALANKSNVLPATARPPFNNLRADYRF